MQFRRAFTLIELIVVVAIVALLMGLLLPAVQKVREAANRVRCQNNLRQLGIALHHYHGSRNHFPAGAQAKPWPADATVPQSSYRWSVFAQLLPFIEQTNVQKSLDMSYPMYGGPFQLYQFIEVNRPAVSQKLDLLLCPSDRKAIVSEGFGPTNYAACTGTGLSTPNGTAWETDGVFHVNSKTRIADLKNGSSQTILLAESILGMGGEGQYGAGPFDPQTVYRYVGPGFGPHDPMAITFGKDECWLNPTRENSSWNYDRHRGYSWADGQYRSALYNHFLAPNSDQNDCIGVTNFFPIAKPNDPQANTPAGWKTARSRHPGGVNVLFGDGSVRFVDNEINTDAWQSLARRTEGVSESGN